MGTARSTRSARGQLLDPTPPSLSSRDHRQVLAVISLGGMAGASARYAIEQTCPAATNALPWATMVVNLIGCTMIGVLMVYIERGRPHPLLRPFAGVGVLGGFTTFSSFAVEAVTLAVNGRPQLAALYELGTLSVAMIGATVGAVLARIAFRICHWSTRRDDRAQ